MIVYRQYLPRLPSTRHSDTGRVERLAGSDGLIGLFEDFNATRIRVQDETGDTIVWTELPSEKVPMTINVPVTVVVDVLDETVDSVTVEDEMIGDGRLDPVDGSWLDDLGSKLKGDLARLANQIAGRVEWPEWKIG